MLKNDNYPRVDGHLSDKKKKKIDNNNCNYFEYPIERLPINSLIIQYHNVVNKLIS